MLSEYLALKQALLKTLEEVYSNLHSNTSVYALLGSDDPDWPFEIRLVAAAGCETDDLKVIDERLFDRAFLDYGFHEVRDENSLEGIAYAPIEGLFDDTACIGVAPVSFFDIDRSRYHMATGIDEDEEESPDDSRFVRFLELVRGQVADGRPPASISIDDTERIKGLLFGYDTHRDGSDGAIIAFQRVQPMWVQQKSSLLLFDPAGEGMQPFAGRSVKIGTSFDFVMFDGNLFFRDLKALEVLFRYRKFVAAQAKDYADSLDGILADFEKLDERIDRSRAVANKLLKLRREGSPVVDMDPEELEGRVNRIGYYSRKIKFDESGKVMLTTDTEVSDFIRLLDDTLVLSPLTAARYESKGKKRLDSDEV